MRAVISLLPHGQIQGLFRQVSFSACLSSARPVSQPVPPAFFVFSSGCLLECPFAVFRLSFCCFPASSPGSNSGISLPFQTCLLTGRVPRLFQQVSLFACLSFSGLTHELSWHTSLFAHLLSAEPNLWFVPHLFSNFPFSVFLPASVYSLNCGASLPFRHTLCRS